MKIVGHDERKWLYLWDLLVLVFFILILEKFAHLSLVGKIKTIHYLFGNIQVTKYSQGQLIRISTTEKLPGTVPDDEPLVL